MFTALRFWLIKQLLTEDELELTTTALENLENRWYDWQQGEVFCKQALQMSTKLREELIWT